MADPIPPALGTATPASDNPSPLTDKITRVGQSLASDLAQGKSPDPTSQTVLEDISFFQSQTGKNPAQTPAVSPAAPPPPPVVPPPVVAPETSPPASAPAPKHKSVGSVVAIFTILGLVILIGLAFISGLAGKVVPGLGTVTLTYWGLWEPQSVMGPILSDFEKTHPGIKVVYTMQSPIEYRERLQAALNQKKGPDIFRINDTWVHPFSNYLSPVPASIYSPDDYRKTFYPTTAKDLKVNGNYVAVPMETEGIAMFINDDILQQSGQTVPQNWDQLRDAAVAMSKCDNPTGNCHFGGPILISGVALGSTQNVDHWEDIIATLLLQNNVNLNNPNQAPNAVGDVFQYFNDFVDNYHVWDPHLPNSTTDFATGKVGIYFGPSWRVIDIQSLNPKLNFSIHPVPQLPVDKTLGESPVTYATYWVEGVNAASPNSKQAWELLKYLSSADVMTKLYHQEIGPQRPFGEPYSRTDLADSLKTDKYAATFVAQAPISQSWYLASFTRDGDQGINTQLSNLFSQAIGGTRSTASLSTEINKILSAYGINPGQ